LAGVGAAWIRKKSEMMLGAWVPGLMRLLLLMLCRSFGLKLLSRVRPSEVLLKSVTKDVRTLEIVHPAR
jgi:hypothetical protein